MSPLTVMSTKPAVASERLFEAVAGYLVRFDPVAVGRFGFALSAGSVAVRSAMSRRTREAAGAEVRLRQSGFVQLPQLVLDLRVVVVAPALVIQAEITIFETKPLWFVET